MAYVPLEAGALDAAGADVVVGGGDVVVDVGVGDVVVGVGVGDLVVRVGVGDGECERVSVGDGDVVVTSGS